VRVAHSTNVLLDFSMHTLSGQHDLTEVRLIVCEQWL
jgi:hypothetical protein